MPNIINFMFSVQKLIISTCSKFKESFIFQLSLDYEIGSNVYENLCFGYGEPCESIMKWFPNPLVT